VRWQRALKGLTGLVKRQFIEKKFARLAVKDNKRTIAVSRVSD
jgi:hypothetical protein